MAHYRIYVTTIDGHITAPPTVIECTDDQEAIGKGRSAHHGKSVELWEARALSRASRATKINRPR
jgi:hypothetical protein